MGKHTPGPWVASRMCPAIEEGIIRVWAEGDGPYIGLVRYSANPGISYEEAVANADLFAAAPDLLEALYEALPFINDDLGAYKKGYVARVEKKIRAAIAKAEGGQNEI